MGSARNTPLVGRLAPSPTGAQHLGNARTFLLAWLSIRARGGHILLRIEDIDSPRVKPWAAQQAIDDLRWLGLDWDEGPDRPGDRGPYVQTERRDRYEQALTQLQAAERVFPCSCTRRDIAAAASAPHAGDEGPLYPGTCSKRTVGDARDLPVPYAWRFRLEAGLRSFDDLFAGHQMCIPNSDLGDFVVFKSNGTPAYQLAVVVDDSSMGVTEVVRGDDLLASTFRQLALYEFFGWQPPQFAHVPLVVGQDGRRLAKRHGDTRLSTLRQMGIAPEHVVGTLAHSAGLIKQPRSITPRELLKHWDWKAVSANRWTWNPAILKQWKTH